MIQEIFKGKGDPGIPAQYRDVLLADDDGKSLFKYIRTAIFPTASQFVFNTQYGSGFSGGECAIAHLSVQLFIDFARHARVSASLLFVDLVQAFASMIRKVCTCDPSGDEQWLASLRAAGFPEYDVQEIYTAISSAHWIGESHEGTCYTTSYPFAVAASVYRNSWFSTEGLVNVVKSNRGSGAGTPLADIIFALSIARVLTVLKQQIADAGLNVTIKDKHDVEIEFTDISYHDDLVLPCVAPAQHIATCTASVAAIVYTVFTYFGFRLNFSAGKTEAIVVFAGPGSTAAARALCLAGSCVDVATGSLSTVLRFVSSYKHLGSMSNIAKSAAEEVTIRSSIITSETKRLRRKVLLSPALSISTKIGLVNGYIFSKRYI